MSDYHSGGFLRDETTGALVVKGVAPGGGNAGDVLSRGAGNTLTWKPAPAIYVQATEPTSWADGDIWIQPVSS